MSSVQGNDRGTQYASVIYCYDEIQKEIALKVKARLQKYLDGTLFSPFSGKTVTTDVRDATTFYKAQEDHQEYLDKNPWGYCNHAYRKIDWTNIP